MDTIISQTFLAGFARSFSLEKYILIFHQSNSDILFFIKEASYDLEVNYCATKLSVFALKQHFILKHRKEKKKTPLNGHGKTSIFE